MLICYCSHDISVLGGREGSSELNSAITSGEIDSHRGRADERQSLKSNVLGVCELYSHTVVRGRG